MADVTTHIELLLQIPIFSLASPCWQGNAQDLCEDSSSVPHQYLPSTTFPMRYTQFSSCPTASTWITNGWRLSKEASALTQQKLSLHCDWHPGFSASVELPFLRSQDIPPCLHWGTASVSIHLSQTSASTQASWRGQPMLLLQPGLENCKFGAGTNMLICFQTSFHFLIWFLITLSVWNPTGKGVSENLKFWLLSLSLLSWLCVQE